MIFEVGGHDLINDFEGNICLNHVSLELIIPVELFDGCEVVSLQDYEDNQMSYII